MVRVVEPDLGFAPLRHDPVLGVDEQHAVQVGDDEEEYMISVPDELSR